MALGKITATGIWGSKDIVSIQEIISALWSHQTIVVGLWCFSLQHWSSDVSPFWGWHPKANRLCLSFLGSSRQTIIFSTWKGSSSYCVWSLKVPSVPLRQKICDSIGPQTASRIVQRNKRSSTFSISQDPMLGFDLVCIQLHHPAQEGCRKWQCRHV